MPPQRILVIDDDAAVGEALTRGIAASGPYDVRLETHATRALSAARDFAPDLVLLDIVMPDLDGDRIAAQMAADPGLRDIPVVLVTGLVAPGELEAGATDAAGRRILAKPVELEELMAVVRDALDT